MILGKKFCTIYSNENTEVSSALKVDVRKSSNTDINSPHSNYLI